MGVMSNMQVERMLGGGRSGGGRGKLSARVDTTWFLDRANFQRLVGPVEQRFLMRAGGYTRRTIRSLIKRKGTARRAPKKKYLKGRTYTKAYRRWLKEALNRPASPAGSPPFTHTGDLKASILFHYDPHRRHVVVGPSAHRIDDLGALHEHGGTRKGKHYPARPFVMPGLQRASAKFPDILAGSV